VTSSGATTTFRPPGKLTSSPGFSARIGCEPMAARAVSNRTSVTLSPLSNRSKPSLGKVIDRRVGSSWAGIAT